MAKARRLQATWTPSSTRVRLSSRMGPVTRRIRLMSVRLLHSTICAVLPVSLSTLTSRSRTLASLVRVSRASRSRPTAPVGRHFVREAEQQHAGDGEQRRQQLHQLRVREGGLVHVQKVGAVGEGDHDEADHQKHAARDHARRLGHLDAADSMDSAAFLFLSLEVFFSSTQFLASLMRR